MFEDIDRFENNTVFERLREINRLANVEENKDKDKNKDEAEPPLRFIYLLRDDMFESKERSKFFDFMLSIVPVMDGSNSMSMLKELLDESKIYDIFDKYFLDTLCMYIDDIRLLKNIYNEFLIYFYRLQTNKPEPNLMMAIIAYKNIFPDDFAKLQVNQGFVHYVFSESERWKNVYNSVINKEINSHNSKLRDGDSSLRLSIDQLVQSYLEEVNNPYSELDPENVEVNTMSPDEISLSHDEQIENLRKQHVIDMSNSSNKIKLLKEDIDSLKQKNIKDIMIEEVIDYIFLVETNDSGKIVDDFAKIKEDHYFDLIRTLIIQGYIDETYRDYLTPFYENELSLQDKLFMSRILGRKGKDYHFKIDSPKNLFLLKRIKVEHLAQIEILNITLFDYILKNDLIIDDQNIVELFINQLRDYSRFEFIEEYYKQTKEVEIFVKKMNYYWSDYFTKVTNAKISITENDLLSEENIHKYSIDSLLYTESEDRLHLVNKNNVLSDYISSHEAYIQEKSNTDEPVDKQEKIDIKNIVESMKKIGVKFQKIDISTIDELLFEAIYQNNLYAINAKNIAIMFFNYQPIITQKNPSKIALKRTNTGKIEELLKENSISKFLVPIKHANYSLISNKGDNSLISYINQNIDGYMDTILYNCDGKIMDNEQVALKLINNENIIVDKRMQYIGYMQVNIKNIKDVTNVNLWESIIINKNQIFNEENCISYFNKKGEFDDAIIEYINGATSKIDFSNLEEKVNKSKELIPFFRCVVEYQGIKNDKCKEIISGISFFYRNFNIVGLPYERVNILIELNKVALNKKNINHIRKYYPNSIEKFIDIDIKKYVDLFPEIDVFHKEVIHIVNSETEDNVKLNALNYTSEPISIIGHNHSDLIASHILNSNYDITNDAYIYANYSGFGEKAKEIISLIAVKYHQEIASEEHVIADELLSILLSSTQVHVSSKTKLLIKSLPNSNEKLLKKHLVELEREELCKIFDTEQVLINGNDRYTTEIIEGLKLYNLIDDYSKNEYDGYTVYKSK